MTIEKKFDVPFIASLALREKQIQQNYRPIIGVHKWFARRPGTLFRGLLLSEFVDIPLRDSFYSSNSLKGLVIVDPFMGGGTPLIEANRVGCDVIGYDINPMSYWTVRQEIEHLDLKAYRRAADNLVAHLEREVGYLYRTKCLECGSMDTPVKYFLWVKQHACASCGKQNDLFPGYLLAEDKRHPEYVYVCPFCGELNGAKCRERLGTCRSCGERLAAEGPSHRNRYICRGCGEENVYPGSSPRPPWHRMYAIEYYCEVCKPSHKGRFFKKPDEADLSKYQESVARLGDMRARFVPDDIILAGDETARLHRWGYQRYREMFNARQLLGLELSCEAISEISDERIRNALATNLSDLLRYQNMLCRYDAMALKSLDIFSVHGFPVSLAQCESNLLGITNGSGVNVGSGGWTNIINKYYKAKAYCEQPFEIRHVKGRKVQVFISGEWIGDQRNGLDSPEKRQVSLFSQSSTIADLEPASIDAVLTDPPYYGNVQYAELMDFCYVWIRKLVGIGNRAFQRDTTRHSDELTGNLTMDRGLDNFAEGLTRVFQKMAKALKPGHPLAFTYHHNRLEAYYPIAVAVLDSSLVFSTSLPCPAEMGASIHISGTGSSIIDTIFVCRSKGSVAAKLLPKTPERLASLLREDVQNLKQAGLKETRGDVRCIIFGHLTRLAVWNLRQTWDHSAPVQEKIKLVAKWIDDFGGFSAVEKQLNGYLVSTPFIRTAGLREEAMEYGEELDEISF